MRRLGTRSKTGKKKRNGDGRDPKKKYSYCILLGGGSVSHFQLVYWHPRCMDWNSLRSLPKSLVRQTENLRTTNLTAASPVFVKIVVWPSLTILEFSSLDQLINAGTIDLCHCSTKLYASDHFFFACTELVIILDWHTTRKYLNCILNPIDSKTNNKYKNICCFCSTSAATLRKYLHLVSLALICIKIRWW